MKLRRKRNPDRSYEARVELLDGDEAPPSEREFAISLKFIDTAITGATEASLKRIEQARNYALAVEAVDMLEALARTRKGVTAAALARRAKAEDRNVRIVQAFAAKRAASPDATRAQIYQAIANTHKLSTSQIKRVVLASTRQKTTPG